MLINDDTDVFFMEQALAQARLAQDHGEVPIGAVLTKRERLLASQHNQSIARHDSSAHAEMLVIREAGQLLKNYRLLGTTLYVTLEPCAMCFTAMIHARIERLVFGASDDKQGVVGGAIQLAEHGIFNHRLHVTRGVLEEQCASLLLDFFEARR